VLVKEDAFMPTFAVAVALALNRWRAMTWADRGVFLLLPTALALTNLVGYYKMVLPALTVKGTAVYSDFWANYGPTPMLALRGMLAHPIRLIVETLTSGFLTHVIVPHLFLPLVGWQWSLGIAPIVALYSASANEQIRAFGIYYSIVLVPFLTIAASSGALIVARQFTSDLHTAKFSSAGAILLGALVVGGTSAGYVLRPWKAEIASMPIALARLSGERKVLVQSGLYPHAGYDARIELLTPGSLQNPENAGAIALMAPKMSAYPFGPHDLDALQRSPQAIEMPDGLITVRLSEAPR
jgi:hypothetical protein